MIVNHPEFQQLFNDLFNSQTRSTVFGDDRIRFQTFGPVRGCKLPDGRTILVQNPNKGSRFAARARSGEKLAWVVPTGSGRWTLLEEVK